MKIDRIEVGPLQTNCYVVSDEKGTGVIIDPGFEEWKIREHIEGIDIKYIILTHGHYDHFTAAKGLMEKTGAKLAIHKIDARYLEDASLSLLCWNIALLSKEVRADIELSEGDILKAGELTFEFIHTPGHTEGSMCILCGNSMFSGDTLFKDGVGRADLPGGSCKTLKSSVKKLAGLTKNYNVYPGHLESTTLDYEKKNNMYLR